MVKFVVSDKTRRIIYVVLKIVFVIILLAIVVTILIIAKRRGGRGQNVMEVFLDDRFKQVDPEEKPFDNEYSKHYSSQKDIILIELKQIPEQYNIPSLKHFRSYNPSTFTIYEPDLLYRSIESIDPSRYGGENVGTLRRRLHEFTNLPFYVYRMCNFCQCPGKKLQWDKQNRELTLSKTIIQNPLGELFIITHDELSKKKCERGCEDARPFIHNDRLYLVCNSTSGENCRREMIIMGFDLLEFLSLPFEPKFAEKTIDAGNHDIESRIGYDLKNNGKINRKYIREVRPLTIEKLIYEDSRDQKNWMPVILRDSGNLKSNRYNDDLNRETIHFVYSINPHIILRYDDNKLTVVAETSNSWLPDNLRGGSQIIWAKKWHKRSKPITSKSDSQETSGYWSEDLLVGLIHTRDGDQAYTTYIYAFGTSYPYKVKYITNGFIFGDKKSHSKKIQFASGLARIVTNGIPYFHITYGENDCTSKLCIMREEIAMGALLPVEQFKPSK